MTSENPDPPTVSLSSLIAAGRVRVEADRAPDSKDIAEVVRLDSDRQKLANQNLATLTELRRMVGKNLICFMWAYFVVSTVIIVASGIPWTHFSLAPNVAVVMVGTTAASVLGLVGTVASGLFGKGD